MSDYLTIGFLVPPTLLITVSALAVWATLWHPRAGFLVALAATSLLYLAALPVIGARMLQDVELKPPEKTDFAAAQAIVVLGGGVKPGDGAPDTLGPWTLQRLDFAAHAYRRLNLRVAVTGGRTGSAHTPEGALMKAVLEADFGVPVTWVETRSRNTYENALYTKKLLEADHITTVVLVTNAWHLRRGLWCFERVGLDAIAYPAPLTYREADRADDYLPSIGALEESYHALHEAIGLAYYRLRY